MKNLNEEKNGEGQFLREPSFSCLNTEAICAIIKECGQNGVRELSLGAFKLSFGPAVAPVMEAVHVSPLIREAQKILSVKETEQMAMMDQEAALQNLMLEDPLAYEEMLKRDEVIDEQRVQDEGSEDRY